MERELTEVYCGNGKGKTALAIGQSIREAVQGRSVIVIQFLKGCEKRSLDFLEEMDNLDFKIFRFEKRDHLQGLILVKPILHYFLNGWMHVFLTLLILTPLLFTISLFTE